MRLSALISILVIFAADQISKWWIIELVLKPVVLPTSADASAMPFFQWLTTIQAPLPFVKIEVLPFFNTVMVWNKGISFGMFGDHGPYGPVILMMIAAAIIAGFLIWLSRSTHPLTSAGIVMIVGGAIGNLLDRVRFGAVADFLDFHVAGLHWPAFNVADSTICIGIAMLLIHGLFFDNKKPANEAITT